MTHVSVARVSACAHLQTKPQGVRSVSYTHLVGTGRIGAAMARICHGFGMTVLAYDQYRNPALDGIVRYVELDERCV